MKPKKYRKSILATLLTAIIFFAVTMPFRQFFRVMAVTEVRPAGALPPAFGLLFGAPGAFGCALGNLVADAMSGYSIPMCILGFAAQFLYGCMPHLLWKMIRKRDRKAPAIIRLNNLKNLLRYIGIVFVSSLMITLLLGGMMAGFGISPLFSTATLMIFFNDFVFCMILGIPIVILVTAAGGNKQTRSINERFILIFLLLGAISACLIGLFAYRELSRSTHDALALWNRVYFYIIADLFVFYGVTVAFLWYAEKHITTPIEALAAIAETYVSQTDRAPDTQQIAAKCDMLRHSYGETGYLAAAFGKMVVDLKHYIDHLTRITAEKERIGAELSVAARIQADMLPRVFPAFPEHGEFDLFASMQPAKEVGGDFYDFFLTDQDHLAIVIADVSGKGVPASLFMVIAKTLIQTHAMGGETPAEIFENVNTRLCENNKEGMFVTAWLGLLTISTGTLSFVNAGHNPPLLKRGCGTCEYIKSRPGFVLAGMEGMRYRQGELRLLAGDTLVLYTDGVTEACNSREELYGTARLIKVLGRQEKFSPCDLCHAVRADIDTFAGDVPQADDITMLCLTYGGTV